MPEACIIQRVKDMLVFDEEVTHNVCQLLISTVLNYMQRALNLKCFTNQWLLCISHHGFPSNSSFWTRVRSLLQLGKSFAMVMLQVNRQVCNVSCVVQILLAQLAIDNKFDSSV